MLFQYFLLTYNIFFVWVLRRVKFSEMVLKEYKKTRSRSSVDFAFDLVFSAELYRLCGCFQRR